MNPSTVVARVSISLQTKAGLGRKITDRNKGSWEVGRALCLAAARRASRPRTAGPCTAVQRARDEHGTRTGRQAHWVAEIFHVWQAQAPWRGRAAPAPLPRWRAPPVGGMPSRDTEFRRAASPQIACLAQSHPVALKQRPTGIGACARPPDERDALIDAGVWLSGVLETPEELTSASDSHVGRRAGFWRDAAHPPPPAATR
jgi:hypothetical protein